jgi:Uncharacterised conserved protein
VGADSVQIIVISPSQRQRALLPSITAGPPRRSQSMDLLNDYETSSTTSSSSSTSSCPPPLLFPPEPAGISLPCSARPPSPTRLLTPPGGKPRGAPGKSLVPNSFPVHIYIPIPDPADSATVRSLLSRLDAHVRLALVNAPCKPQVNRVQNLHVSLSRPVRIVAEQIPVLLDGLRTVLSEFKRAKLPLTDIVETFVGEGGTRTFLAAVVKGDEPCPVVPLIRAVDRVFAGFGLQTFFVDARPHVSFAWLESDEAAEQFCFGKYPASPLVHGGFQCHVEILQVQCKVGMCTYSMNLQS